MCGIVGLFSPSPRDPHILRQLAERMQEAHRFRGPDGEGVWANNHVALANVRLAIQGSKEEGRQPLKDRWGGHLVFTGEVYEARDIMQRLGEEYHPDDSDGVALGALLARKGPQGLAGLRGMFALANYDSDGRLLLARDTWGQKPLYLARWEDGWAFSSTIAALQIAVGRLEIRTNAMLEYLVYKSVGGLHTSFDGIEQVAPGSWISFSPGGSVRRGRYVQDPKTVDAIGSAQDIRRQLDIAIDARATTSFVDAVLLSGGADSSIVAASLVRQRPDVKKVAFSVGYDVVGPEDETHYARRMAQHLGMPHEVICLTGTQVPALMEEVARFTEDPIQDPVTLPTLVLSREIAKVTKVALSGDGSDEFWGGYERFDNAPPSLEEYLSRTMLFKAEELGLDSAPTSYLDGLCMPSPDLPALDQILQIEASNRLRNYHLNRIDKLGMAAALEIRSPFLDANVTQLAGRISSDVKRPAGRAKGLLLDAFSSELPRWLLDRKKQPYTMPIVTWLSAELRFYAHDVLSNPNAWVRRFVEPAPYLEQFTRTQNPTVASRLWSLLQLEAWHRVWKDRLA